MDADDISDPNRLKVQYDFLEKNPQYSWCGCNARLLDENGIWGTREMPEAPAEKDYLKYSPYIHPTVMYRASLFEETDGYKVSEETLLCEDYEIFMRLRQMGKEDTIYRKHFLHIARIVIHIEDVILNAV